MPPVSRYQKKSLVSDKHETFPRKEAPFVFMQYKIPSAIYHPFSDFILRYEGKVLEGEKET